MKHCQSITCRFILLVCLTVALVSSAAGETLTDASIIELQGLNLGDAVIIEKIQTSQCNFDTSIEGLKTLKAANVSGAVIQTMLAKNSASGTAAGNSSLASSNDPSVPHSPGIWLLQETNGVKTMTKVGWETPAEITHGGFIGPWGIGKYSTTARFTGTQSSLQLSQSKPEFYLYTGGTSYDDLRVESPNEITLAQFTVIAKDAKRNADERAVDVGTTGAYASSHGVDHKAVREFDSEKIADGIYKIVPHDNLADGEYGFCSSDAANAYGGLRQKFYTFGIDSK
jgi:hypothetical protein